jgi:hypothetical protein
MSGNLQEGTNPPTGLFCRCSTAAHSADLLDCVTERFGCPSLAQYIAQSYKAMTPGEADVFLENLREKEEQEKREQERRFRERFGKDPVRTQFLPRQSELAVSPDAPTC